MKYYKKILPNGLTVLEVPSSEAESVVVDFFVRTGSRSESAKENGISHFLEHFLFKGTKKYPTAMAITELIDGIGGEMNANTGKEHTQYYIKAHSKQLPLIFEVLTSMIQEPLLDKIELEKEKGVIVEELNMYKDMPNVEAEEVLDELMWVKDSLGRRIVGQVETVTKFTVPMFESYLKRHYQTPNMVLGVSGNYNRKQLNDLIRKHWLTVPKQKYSIWAKAKTKQTKALLKVTHKDTNQTHLIFGFRSFGIDDKRRFASSVLSAVLGGGMSSRLFDEIREKRGLAYYVRCAPHSFQDTGLFSISAGVQVSKCEEAIQVILGELGKLKIDLISPKELYKAKEYIKGRITLALEDNQSKLDWYLDQVAFQKAVYSPKELFKNIDKVTAEEVRKLSRQLFVSRNLNLSIVGPYKSDKGFNKIINKF